MSLFYAFDSQAQTWTEMTLPIIDEPISGLSEIQVISQTEIYAVGFKGDDPFSTKVCYLLRWDGAVWTEILTPISSIPSSFEVISQNDVYVLAGNELWHFDGADWVDLTNSLPHYNSNPNFDPRTLKKMISFGQNDVWIIGGIDGSISGSGQTLDTYAVHWDGNEWTETPIPQIGGSGDFNYLEAVDGSSANDIWAVGRGLAQGDGTTKCGVYHYNGSSWSLENILVNAAGTTDMRDVDVVSENNIWISGDYAPSQAEITPLYMHFDGAAWNTISSSSISQNQRDAICELNSQNVWSGAFGDFTFYNGTNWTKPTTVMSSIGGSIKDIKRTGNGLIAVGQDANLNAFALYLEEVPLSISKDLIFNSVSVFPNPASNNLNVNLNNESDFEKVIFKIYDCQKRLIRQTNSAGQNNTLNLSGLSNGIYLLVVIPSTSNSYRFIKN